MEVLLYQIWKLNCIKCGNSIVSNMEPTVIKKPGDQTPPAFVSLLGLLIFSAPEIEVVVITNLHEQQCACEIFAKADIACIVY